MDNKGAVIQYLGAPVKIIDSDWSNKCEDSLINILVTLIPDVWSSACRAVPVLIMGVLTCCICSQSTKLIINT